MSLEDPFRYSCFISYSSGDELMERFVVELKNLLESYQSFYLKDKSVFLDRDRMRGGSLIDSSLARALCESICMIVVYTPSYEDRPYCLQEFAAMEALEKQRLELIQPHTPDAGLIIPIILRIDDQIPSKIKSLRKFHDFSRVYLNYRRIDSNPRYREKIDEIALTIRRLYNAFRKSSIDPCLDCPSFSLPNSSADLYWAKASSRHAPPFPGREEGR